MTKLEAHFANKTHIIWDWNGTLLDDVEICIETMQDILVEYELPRLDRARYHEAFCFPVRQYYVNLGFELEKKHSFEVLSEKFVAGYASRLEKCDLHFGTRELLSRLQYLGKQQAILSAAPENDLVGLLRQFRIDKYFDHVYGLTNIYAAGKIERGRQLIADWKANQKNTILVGDTEHDLEVAHDLGIDAILLDGGHHSFERLKKRHSNTVERR